MGSAAQANTESVTATTNEMAVLCPPPAITLQPLAAHDPLRRKWQLGAGLPPSSKEHWQEYEAAQEGSAQDNNGHLRLSTQHTSGEPWECLIPFAELARMGGVALGRCPQTADITLPHESVSRRHALLEIAENGLVITDLNSTNGTCVNEVQLSPYDRRVPLSHGMDILLGNANLRLEYIHPTTP